MVKVWAKNEDVRKLLKHPQGGGFRDEGPVEWPDDSFTFRRIKDGDVLTKAPVTEAHVATPKAAVKTEKKSYE